MRRHASAAAVFALAAGAAQAQPDAASAHAQSLAATCAACHGTAGRPPPGAAIAPLAGMPAAILVARMQAFKSGARPSTVMQQLARGYSDAQIELLAGYFATRPRP